MERPFVAENTKERERLKVLISRITDEELKLPLYEEGWTVTVALAHLAFWDQRALALMKKWEKNGVTLSPADGEIINNALIPVLMTIPARAAAELAVSSAEAIDKELEDAPLDLISAIESTEGSPTRLYRSTHRKIHLDAIETLLKNKRNKQ